MFCNSQTVSSHFPVIKNRDSLFQNSMQSILAIVERYRRKDWELLSIYHDIQQKYGYLPETVLKVDAAAFRHQWPILQAGFSRSGPG